VATDAVQARLKRVKCVVALALYHPGVETIFDPKMVEIGSEPAYRNRESRLAVQQRATAEWGEWRFEPESASRSSSTAARRWRLPG
jgi:hypothetical protein